VAGAWHPHNCRVELIARLAVLHMNARFHDIRHPTNVELRRWRLEDLRQPNCRSHHPIREYLISCTFVGEFATRVQRAYINRYAEKTANRMADKGMPGCSLFGQSMEDIESLKTYGSGLE
jgi:hypothetical protein